MRAYFHQAILMVQCPRCHRGPTHWCRDERGTCVMPHAERRRVALKESLRAYAPLSVRPEKEKRSA